MNVLADIVTNGADQFGDRTAFRSNGDSLTYSQLYERTGRLAATLQQHGVKRGDRVGIFMRKCMEVPIALFGILRAGAAYVPLDVTSPPDRIAGLVKDCGIAVIVTSSDDARAVRKLLKFVSSPLTVIGHDESEGTVQAVPWAEVEKRDGSWTDVPLGPSDLAYVMYTSGSTGLPKGIMHTHASGLAYASAAAQLYGIRPDDRLSNHSPLHFDMSTFDFFSGPMSGASTTIISASAARMPASLSSLIERDQLTIWYSVPFALMQLMEHGLLSERNCTSIRWVLFGGEPFPVKHLRRLMRLWPHAEFANVYGPAEVNQCTHYTVPDKEWSGDPDAVPLGRMWSAARGIVVDEDGECVSGSTVGELLVDTATMMSGYWNRPDLSAEGVTVRTEGHDTRRYYRTGDLVYRNDDDELVFVGRRDHQIKIRGYRVELNEIEAALVQHYSVLEAAAFPIEREPGMNVIACAVKTQGDEMVDPTDLVAHVRGLIPAYAVPTEIHIVTEFPRTGTDKIDRRALQTLFTNHVHS